MMKGIIVVDIPSCCGNCRMGFENECSDEFECFLEPTKHLENPDKKKPFWCPIRPMPERKDFDGHVENPMIGTAEIAFRMGWNACLDSIEGREKQ